MIIKRKLSTRNFETMYDEKIIYLWKDPAFYKYKKFNRFVDWKIDKGDVPWHRTLNTNYECRIIVFLCKFDLKSDVCFLDLRQLKIEKEKLIS